MQIDAHTHILSLAADRDFTAAYGREGSLCIYRARGILPSHRPPTEAEWRAAGVTEDGFRVAPAAPSLGSHEIPATGGEPSLERLRGVTAQRHDALLRALAEDADQPVAAGQVGEVQADDLGDARSGAVEHLEERPVPARDGVLPAGRVEDLRDLRLRQRLREAQGQPSRLDVRRRV